VLLRPDYFLTLQIQLRVGSPGRDQQQHEVAIGLQRTLFIVYRMTHERRLKDDTKYDNCVNVCARI